MIIPQKVSVHHPRDRDRNRELLNSRIFAIETRNRERKQVFVVIMRIQIASPVNHLIY